ncbi:Peptidase M23 [uncultured Caudovirales phage]|uniref:Peptidase M23 n=1 Tax=uncultured Caudovirales phage TaxID=2100421 RepID=A0A6J5KLR0_9CAUD|nr:Peptidase M23 [uncultured Caudovirales phage]
MLRAISALAALTLVLMAHPVHARESRACGSIQLPLMEYQRTSQGYHGAHHGVDLVAPAGSVIMSAQSGVVTFVGWNGPYGRMVEITHEDGITTRYGHLKSWVTGLRPGMVVVQGQEIGRVGSSGTSTGPHLHFEVRVAGQHTDPVVWLGMKKCR